MNEADALSTARDYVSEWEVPWGETVDSTTHRAGIWVFKYTWAFTFKFKSEFGTGEIDVHANSGYQNPVDRLDS